MSLAICGGLMRTGSVAMYQIMREVVEATGRGVAPKLPLNHEMEEWEQNVDAWATGWDIINVLKLHRWMPMLEPYTESMRVVMTIRDMRDVVVSLMNFRGGTFEDTLNSKAVIGNIEGQAEWEARIPPDNLLKIRYEDFMADRAGTTEAVAFHMGVTLAPRLANNIQRAWNLQANIRRASMEFREDDREFMSKRHIHSGKVGQWRKALTLPQVRQIEEVVGREWFIDNGYNS